MATYRKMLKDYEGNNIIPLGTDGANIEVTNVDPGEGEDLGENDFIAVYGSLPDDKLVYADDPTELENPLPHVGTSDIEDEAVDASKINWGSLGFQYKTTSQSNFTGSSSAWTGKDVPNHNFTFTGVVGGIYKITYHSTYVANNSSNTETDCYLQAVSGLTDLTNSGRVTMVNTHGVARTMVSFYRATATSCSVKVAVSTGEANNSLRFDGGFFSAERVA